MKKVMLTLEITGGNELDVRKITTEATISSALENSEEVEIETICKGIYKIASLYFKEGRERYRELSQEKQIDWRRDN